jgi:hypothetical protein
MPSEQSKNNEPLNNQATARLYDKLSHLHLEIASVYAELAAPKPHAKNEEKVVPINSKSGKLLATLSVTDGKAKVEAASYLPTDNAPYTWLNNHLKSLADKEALRFRLGEEGRVLKFIEIQGNITPELARKLESALRWTLNRMVGDDSTASKEPGAVCKDGRTGMEECPSKTEEEGVPNA